MARPSVWGLSSHFIKEDSLTRRNTARKLLKYFDADGDGAISMTDFRNGMIRLMRESEERRKAAEALLNDFHNEHSALSVLHLPRR
jgi:hypothetical protein